jgi:acetyl esterase/lipase
VAASISYRLRPGSQPLLPKAADAIDDGMEAVRWLRANAATYGIDTTRIAAMGTSAGGVVALGMALFDDPTPGGPLAAVSPRIDAAVSTGAHLTPGLSTLTLGPEDPAALLVHFELDDTTGNSSEYAFETCAAVRSAGSTCDFEEVPGEGHQSWITPGGPLWTSRTGPFLFEHLRLG